MPDPALNELEVLPQNQVRMTDWIAEYHPTLLRQVGRSAKYDQSDFYSKT